MRQRLHGTKQKWPQRGVGIGFSTHSWIAHLQSEFKPAIKPKSALSRRKCVQPLQVLYPPLGQKCDTSCVLTIWPKRDHQRYSSLFWKEFKEQITDRGKIVKFRNNLDFGRLEICQLEELHLRLLAMCMMKTEGRLPQNLQSNFDPSRSSFHDHN